MSGAWAASSAATDLCVPLVLVYDQAEKPARATVAEVYAQIKKDLDQAAGLLAGVKGAARAEKPTIDAVNALYARYYIDLGDYTNAAGHKEGDWIIDKEPTTDAEGQRHKVCTVCGETLITETIEKLYNMATTDSKGEAVVGGYLVIVTDTDTKNPVANATVVLNKDGTISVRLPDGRILDYADQTTVTVLLNKDKTPVKELLVVVTDRNGNYSAEKTDANGQITVPGTSGVTGPDGRITIGWVDADGNPYTITLKVVDYENGRPIEGAVVTIGKTGNISKSHLIVVWICKPCTTLSKVHHLAVSACTPVHDIQEDNHHHTRNKKR